MNEHGVLAVISGFSGAGKGTLMKALLEKYDNYALSISATTRNPREGEADGREYFFVTEDRFKEMIGQDALIEYAQYVNHYYGTPKEYVLKQMELPKMFRCILLNLQQDYPISACWIILQCLYHRLA